MGSNEDRDLEFEGEDEQIHSSDENFHYFLHKLHKKTVQEMIFWPNLCFHV